MKHPDLTENHRLETWVYANTAARTGASGFVSGDVGKLAYQSDDGTYWRLTATTPTWAQVGGSGSAASITVQEADGTPLVLNVTTIKVSNGDLTDEGNGVVKIKTAAEAAGGGGSSVGATLYLSQNCT